MTREHLAAAQWERTRRLAEAHLDGQGCSKDFADVQRDINRRKGDIEEMRVLCVGLDDMNDVFARFDEDSILIGRALAFYEAQQGGAESGDSVMGGGICQEAIAAGDRVVLLKSIWDDGEDHHPPSWLAYAGEVLNVKAVYGDSLSVAHDGASGAFIVRTGEYRKS